MKVESVDDIRLISRAVKENWDIPKAEVIAALMEPINNRDPDLMVNAAEVLRKMDETNIKREALRQRELKANEDRRIQLLELAQRIPVGELAKLASSNGIIVDGSSSGRTTEPAGVDGPKKSSRKRPKSSTAKKPAKKKRSVKKS